MEAPWLSYFFNLKCISAHHSISSLTKSQYPLTGMPWWHFSFLSLSIEANYFLILRQSLVHYNIKVFRVEQFALVSFLMEAHVYAVCPWTVPSVNKGRKERYRKAAEWRRKKVKNKQKNRG